MTVKGVGVVLYSGKYSTYCRMCTNVQSLILNLWT